jgi:hypothetical protein
MQRTFATVLLTAASLIAPAVALAQRTQTATIPFDFTVKDSLLPAGTYRIAYIGTSLVSLRGWQGRHMVSAMTLLLPTSNVRKNPDKLIFNRYGDQYFLSEIRGELGEAAGGVTPSKLEQRLQREQAAGPKHEKTELALK